MTRTFTDVEAKRENTPLLLGLVGPSGSGKTYSALRLATGIQSVAGGEIYLIDTEARRALHYADKFKFRHLELGAPFGSLDYLAAIEHCVARGAKTIIVDSMSHEHEGPGGLLEFHTAETARIAKLWGVNEMKASIPAWGKPKEARRKMINTILQMPVNFVFCFRAKEKMKIVTGRDPVQLGWMPIAGEEFVYEMVAKMLLMPGAGGVPTWSSDLVGERMMIKLPEQFRDLFAAPKPLDEQIGAELARWASGGETVRVDAVRTITTVEAKQLFFVAQKVMKGSKERASLLVRYLLEDRGLSRMRDLPKGDLGTFLKLVERGVDNEELERFESEAGGTDTSSPIPE